MELFLLSLRVVLPLFINMAAGYTLKRIRMLDDHTLTTMNNVVFRFFLPLLLFYNIYQTDLKTAFNLKLIIYSLCSVFLLFLILCIVIPFIEKENHRRGVLIQGIFRSNFILFGLPVAMSLFGEQNVGVTSVLIAVIVPLFNVLAVLSLEMFKGGKIDVKSVLRGIATNPLIIAAVLGILFLLLKIRIPIALEKSIADLSRVATPLALVILGGTFTFGSVKGYVKQLVLGIAGRLIIVPAIFLSLGALLGFRGVEFASLLALFASPAAVSSFVMAQQMDGDSNLAGALVVIGSTCSIITVFFWVYLFMLLRII